MAVNRNRTRDEADDTCGISVRRLGKRYWLRQRLPPTLQNSVMAIVRGVGSSPFWALRDVSFEVRAGESVGIIGSNGAGKSTLLSMICGLGRPTEGQVDVRGRVGAILQLGAGFHPYLTGRENLYVAAVLGGLRRREVDALFDEIVEFAELQDFIDQPLMSYSSGMQMRLGFSVAIHIDPALLIVDEALSVGDAHFSEKCIDRLTDLRRSGKTLVMVSHDMGSVRRFCTRALWLRRGRLVADGPSEHVTEQYEAAVANDTLTGSLEGREPVEAL